ncbi:diguanylate cyclase [uncultured Oxalicibacterium sp.]|uniref:diguanylate cyclase n=1 Tax=uncultured Oxalicibacterium sp. TaxID=1168540 RepID=UPI0025F538B5|nr:diguanylate cyclase [uncultured Oxalicibacterium sp.]
MDNSPDMRIELGLHIPDDERKIMVLLVDDQPMVGEAIRRALLNDPHIDFHYCEYADNALAVAEKTRPTVILQDLVMPGVDGLTLVRQYRSNLVTANIPVIVLSTREDAEVKRDAFAAGVNDYLVKVPETIEMIARIRYHARAYNNMLQRDAAYRALRESQQQLQKTNFELQRLTNTDGLTGIANRRYLDEYLSAEWRRARREQKEISLLLIDIDNFKSYNDTYGHVVGDHALKQVAHVMETNILRSTDLCTRYGGEEFAVVLPATGRHGAIVAADKICKAVEALKIPHEQSSTGEWLTVSIGVASIVPQAEGGPDDLISLADKNLYQAKSTGKNRVVSDITA